MAENRLACTPKLMALCCVPEMQCMGWEGLGCWRVPAWEGLLAQSWRGTGGVGGCQGWVEWGAHAQLPAAYIPRGTWTSPPGSGRGTGTLPHSQASGPPFLPRGHPSSLTGTGEGENHFPSAFEGQALCEGVPSLRVRGTAAGLEPRAWRAGIPELRPCCVQCACSTS